MDKKILIIGASGLVGSYILRHFAHCGGFEVFGADFNIAPGAGFKELDVRREEDVKKILNEFHPEIVIVPAAIPNVEFCETNPADTRPTNVLGMKNIIRNINKNSLFVFFSSDYVFDGAAGPYGEDAETNPINEYGRQKLAIEDEIKNNLDNFLIIRTTGVYGWHPSGKNYVMQVIRKLSGGEEVRAPHDQIYCPTYAGELALAVFQLVSSGQRGVFNVVGDEAADRFEFTKKISSVFGLHAERIKSIATAEMNLKAKRPPKSDLKIDKLLSCGIRMSGVNEGLKKMREELSPINNHG